MKRVLIVAIALIGLATPLRAQLNRLGGELGPRYLDKSNASRPVPHLPDGQLDLSGVWRDGGGDPPAKLIDPLMLPWAKKELASRKPELNPYFVDCAPAGPLRMSGGMAWRFVQQYGGKYIFWLYEGNVHSYRQIFMDGRKHPDDAFTTFYGHSIGKWEGDMLVVDTTFLNDKWWMDQRGTPHTEQMHLVEKWTRPDFITLHRVIQIDDPGTFSKPFEYSADAKLTVPESEILEYFCQENNQYGRPGGIIK